MSEFLGEFLDRTVHECGGGDVVAHQHLVERTLGDCVGGFAAQGIVTAFLQRLAQAVQNPAERALAGAVAEKALLVLQLDIETVDVDRGQTGPAVAGDARRRDDIFGHCPYPRWKPECTTAVEPFGFRRGNDE